MSKENDNRVIPTTELRRFYEHLKIFGSTTTFHIVRDFNRSSRKQALIKKMMEKSFTHFSLYNNVNEPFQASSKRKPLPRLTTSGRYKSTQEVVNQIKEYQISGARDYNRQFKIQYLDREIDPRRMTKAKFETGLSGKSSGVGGIDLIAWDTISISPFLGEIKTRTDKNAFLALMQLLTYFIEITTPNQIARCNRCNLFPKDISSNSEFKLGVIFADFNHYSMTQVDILKETKLLAHYLQSCSFSLLPRFEFYFLNMTKPFKEFEVL